MQDIQDPTEENFSEAVSTETEELAEDEDLEVGDGIPDFKNWVEPAYFG
jgi:hypothetical protein